MKKTDVDFLKLMDEKYAEFMVQDESRDTVDFIPTGSTALDVSTGVGGIPRGRITTLYGPDSSGKTTLALSIAKQAYLLGLKVLYIDPENSLDYRYTETLIGSIDHANLIIMQPNTAEQAFEIAEAGIKSGEFGLIIFDSIGALAPQKVLDGEFSDAHVAIVARMLGQFLSRSVYQIRASNTAFLFVNQVRAKIGSYVAGYDMPGGFALKHDSSLVIMLTKAEEIKQGTESIGILAKFVVKKNKMSAPFKTSYIPIIFGKGVDYYRDLLSFAETIGITPKRGAYYTFEGDTIGQGMVKTIEYLKNNKETLDKIIKACYDANIKSEVEI